MPTLITTEVINNLVTVITRESKYPLPWVGEKKDRPKDYFEQIKTHIAYTENEQNIEIIIPISNEQDNRKRKLDVLVDGQPFPFNKAGLAILDMNQTFDIPEMYKLLAIANNAPPPSANDQTLRACLPFFYVEQARYQLPHEKKAFCQPDGHIKASNGDLQKLVSSYIKAMKNQPGKRRELYIPVATFGLPHHWNMCILAFDEQNKPSVTYLESSDVKNTIYDDFYKYRILPEINQVLKEHGYKSIKRNEILYATSKQFSQKGCGINVSVSIEKLFNGTLTEGRGLTIEEDAVRRAQLAFKLTLHEERILQWRAACPEHQMLTKKSQYGMEIVLRELATHPRTLKMRAEESFPKNEFEAICSSKLVQIKQKIDTKNEWFFGGLLAYSQYKTDDQRTHIPKGIRIILDIIKNDTLSDSEKIAQIEEVAQDRKGVRGASLLSLGLFTRSVDTQEFYKEILELCTEIHPVNPNRQLSP